MNRVCLLVVSLTMLAGCAGGARVGTAPAPGAAVASAQMARVAERLRAGGDTAAAATVYQAARRQDSRDPAVLLGLADSLRQLGDYREAVAVYEDLLQIEPRHVEAMRGLAGTLIALNEAGRARDLLLVAVAANDNDPRLYSALGVANDRLGEHDSAQAWYRAGLRIRPDDVTLRHNLALSLILSGQGDQGLELMRRVAADPAATAANRRGLALAESMVREQDTLTAVAPTQPAPVAPVSVATIAAPQSDASAPTLGGRAQTPNQPTHQTEVTATPAADAALATITVASQEADAAPGRTAPETSGATLRTDAAGTDAPPIPRLRPGGLSGAMAAAAASTPAPTFAALAPAAGANDDDAGYQVQLGALDSEDSALRHWRSLARRLPDLFELLTPRIYRATPAAGSGVVYRLRTDPLPRRSDAERLCAAMKRGNISCFVIRNDPQPQARSPRPGQNASDTG